jgi:hypothetical protein
VGRFVDASRLVARLRAMVVIRHTVEVRAITVDINRPIFKTSRQADSEPALGELI